MALGCRSWGPCTYPVSGRGQVIYTPPELLTTFYKTPPSGPVSPPAYPLDEDIPSHSPQEVAVRYRSCQRIPCWVAQGHSTGIERLPLVRPPVVHTGVEGDALLLAEAPPVRRTLLGSGKTGREALGGTRPDKSIFVQAEQEVALPLALSLSGSLDGRREDQASSTHVCWPSPCSGLDPFSPTTLAFSPAAHRAAGTPASAVLARGPHSPRILRQGPICVSAAVATVPGTRALTAWA